MSQFGGSPRDQDFGYFTTATKPVDSPSQFAAAAVAAQSPDAPLEPVLPAFGLPAPARGAHAQPTRSRLLPALVVVALLIAFIGSAVFLGWVPGINQSADSAADSDEQAGSSASVVVAPPRLLGWTEASDGEAKRVNRLLGPLADSGSEGTSFLYVDDKNATAMYGEVTLAPATKAERGDLMDGVADGLAPGSDAVSTGSAKTYAAGALGGSFRCAELGTSPPSTACVFSNSSSSGVVVVMGAAGNSAVRQARAAREAIITSR